jgi:anti-anti-sigma regulatory factor
MVAAWLNLDEPTLVSTLREAGEKLDGTEGEVLLDFAAVRRIGSREVSAIDEFAHVADEKGVRVLLRGVTVDVYKVLKLGKIAPGFLFER